MILEHFSQTLTRTALRESALFRSKTARRGHTVKQTALEPSTPFVLPFAKPFVNGFPGVVFIVLLLQCHADFALAQVSSAPKGLTHSQATSAQKSARQQNDESQNRTEQNPDKSHTDAHFRIGALCEPAPQLLRSHLKLGDEGLVVVSIAKDTPAAKSGLQIDDLLLTVNDTPLTSAQCLVDAIADSQGKELQLRGLRHGDAFSVTVTPVLMKHEDILRGLLKSSKFADPARHDFSADDNQHRVLVFGPAMLLSESAANTDRTAEEVVQQAMKQAKSQPDPEQAGLKELQQQIRSLEQQILQLSQQMKSLQ